MDHAGVVLPPGAIGDLVSLRVPKKQPFGVSTEFGAWTTQEVVSRLASGGTRNLGEVLIGDDVQVAELARRFPGLTPNQYRIFQVRVVIHELFHAADFGDVLPLVNGDHDAAIHLQQGMIGLGSNPAGYARNEISTDMRTRVVLVRSALLFADLVQDLDDYRTYWEGQGPMSEQDFDNVLQVLNRTRFP